MTSIHEAIAYAHSMILADVEDGYYEDGAILQGFPELHEHVDANEYVIAALEAFGIDEDDATANAIAEGITLALHASPIRVAVAA